MRQRKWHGLWTAYLWAGFCVLVFTILSTSILGLQQRILRLTNETSEILIPQFLEQIRAVRNLEMLAHYGSLAAKGEDPGVRQEAAFLAAFAAANPGNQADDQTRLLASDAYHLIQAIAAREQNPGEWKPMEKALFSRADKLAVSTGQLIMQRATTIRDDSLTVRNVAIALALLFAGGMGMMLILGRFLTGQIRVKSELFNEASHDFRQRLHGLQLLINTAKRSPASRGSTIVTSFEATTNDLQRYLENLLEIARLDAVAIKPVPKKIVLQEIFQRLELQFQEAALHHGVDIKFRHTRFSCVSDEKMLLRILENLIANAMKFARSKVLVAACRRGGQIEVCVVDNGPGMPEFKRRALYKAFVQGGGDGQQAHQGFGLGLSIVMRLAGLLNAPIKISAKAGRGSMVRIRFGVPPEVMPVKSA